MPDIPGRAVEPAAAALCELHDLDPEWAQTLARAALEAAAPLLAETLLTPLVKRHAPVPGGWDGTYCGVCWNKDGSRPVWPCGETLAIAEFLPARDTPEVPDVP